MTMRRERKTWSPMASLAVPLALGLVAEGAEAAPAAPSRPDASGKASAPAATAFNRVDGLSVDEREDGATALRLQGSRKPTFNVYRMPDPERLIVDIAASERGRAVPHVPLDTWACSRVTLETVLERGAKLTRVTVELKREVSYIVVPDGNDLVVTVTPREVPPEAWFQRKSAQIRRAEIEADARDADRMKRGASALMAEAEALNRIAARKASEADEREGRAERRAADAETAERRAREAAAKALAVEEAARAAVEQAKTGKRRARKELEDAENERKRAEQERQRAEAARGEAERILGSARGEAERERKELSEARRRLEEARVRAEAELASAAAEHKSAKDARQAAERARVAAEQVRRSAEDERRVVAAERKSAAAERKSAEAERESAKHALAEASRVRASAASELQKAEQVRRSAESSREQAEREHRSAQAVRSEAEAALARAESALAGARAEKDSAGKARKEADAALAAARKDAAREHKAGEARAAAEGALAQARAAETAARSRQKQAEQTLGQLEQERARLARVLGEDNRRREQVEQSIATRASELSRLEAKVVEARRRFDELGGRVSAADVEKAEQRAAQARATSTVLHKEVERLRSEATSARTQADEAGRRLKKLEGERGATEQQLARAREDSRRATEEARAVERRLGERKARLGEVDGQVAAQVAELDRLKGQRDQLVSQGDELKRHNARAQRELTVAESELGRVKDELREESERLAALEAAVLEAQQRLDRKVADYSAAAAERPAPAAAPAPAPALARASEKTVELPRPAAASSTISDVRFEDDRHESRVIVRVEGPLHYAPASAANPSTQVVKLSGTRLPSKLERSLDASGYGGPVRTITSFGEGGDVKIVVATRGPSQPTLEQRSGALIWRFPKVDPAAKREAVARTEAVSIAPSKVSGYAVPRAVMASTAEPVEADSSSGRNRSKWRGERIDIELQDAPIKDVLLLFSDIGRVNIIAGKGVQGTVTLKLTSVPWDQALDIILRSLNLGMVREGNVIRVATMDDIEAERRLAIERANAQVQLKPLETRLVPVSYAPVADMIPKVQSVLSSRGSVTPDQRTNMLIIMDVAENIALAEQLVSQLDAQTPQVLIEARIVEARTNFLRQLGIQWGFDYTASQGTGNPTGLLFPNSLGVAGGAASNTSDVRGLILPRAASNPNYAVDLPAPAGSGSGGALGFSFGSITGNLNTNLRLSAAEDSGEVRIISAPKIVTLDNIAAQIQQGVQIPISQVSAQGVNTRYVNATLALQVTPHVTNEGAVQMDVTVQKNEADFINTGARGDPTILTKQAQSRMLVSDGDTAVIGGIYTRNKSINFKKVPWVADIPIIGWFFKNKSEGDTRTEVLIFLTPKIVNRASSIGG